MTRAADDLLLVGRDILYHASRPTVQAGWSMLVYAGLQKWYWRDTTREFVSLSASTRPGGHHDQ